MVKHSKSITSQPRENSVMFSPSDPHLGRELRPYVACVAKLAILVVAALAMPPLVRDALHMVMFVVVLDLMHDAFPSIIDIEALWRRTVAWSSYAVLLLACVLETLPLLKSVVEKIGHLW